MVTDKPHLKLISSPEDSEGVDFHEASTHSDTGAYIRRKLGGMPFSSGPLMEMLGESGLDVDEVIHEVDDISTALDRSPPTQEDYEWFRVRALEYFGNYYEVQTDSHKFRDVPRAAQQLNATNLVMLKYAVASRQKQLWAEQAKDDATISTLSVQTMQDFKANMSSKAYERVLPPYKFAATCLIEAIESMPEKAAALDISVDGVQKIVERWESLPREWGLREKRELYKQLNRMQWSFLEQKLNVEASELDQRISNLLAGQPMTSSIRQ